MRAKPRSVRGIWQREEDTGGLVCHLIAGALTDLIPLLGRLAEQGNDSRDFR